MRERDRPPPARARPRARRRSRITAALLLAVVLPVSSPLAAQSGDGDTDESEIRAPRTTDDTARVPDREAVDAELRAERIPSWSPWITRGAGFAMLLASDVGMRTTIQDLRAGDGALGGEDSFGAEMAEFGNGLGDWQTSLPWLAAGSLAVGAVADGLRGAGRGLAVLGGIAAGTMSNEALNRAVGRSRPIWGEGAFTFDPFSGHASFPSGHVSLAFSLAGGIDAVTDGWLPATAAYAAAGTTAFGRLYDDKHWLSDVVVAGALSATVSRLATRRAMRLLGVAGDGEAADGDPAGTGGRADGAPTDGPAAGPGPAADGSRPLRARLLFTPSLLGVQLRF